MTDAVLDVLPSVVEPEHAVRLVLGIARLGEVDLAGWWSSQGLNPAVAFALAGFRRTGRVVGAELALLSAVRRHRQILPRDNAVHLFSPRLRYLRWAQAHLAELKTSGRSSLLDELSGWATVGTATAIIRQWRQAIAPASASRAAGVVTEKDLSDPALFAWLVDGYLETQGELSVPYVDLA